VPTAGITPLLGAVETEDAEVLRANGLNARRQLAARLLQDESCLAGTPTRRLGPSHEALLSGSLDTSIPQPKGSLRKRSFLLSFPPNLHTTALHTVQQSNEARTGLHSRAGQENTW
jgi:hypothetical protein